MIQIVLSISVLAYDGDLLRRGDVVPWSDSGRLGESEESGEEGRGDVDGESYAHMRKSNIVYSTPASDLGSTLIPLFSPSK
jgi:hypothetical protein